MNLIHRTLSEAIDKVDDAIELLEAQGLEQEAEELLATRHILNEHLYNLFDLTSR